MNINSPFPIDLYPLILKNSDKKPVTLAKWSRVSKLFYHLINGDTEINEATVGNKEYWLSYLKKHYGYTPLEKFIKPCSGFSVDFRKQYQASYQSEKTAYYFARALQRETKALGKRIDKYICEVNLVNDNLDQFAIISKKYLECPSSNKRWLDLSFKMLFLLTHCTDDKEILDVLNQKKVFDRIALLAHKGAAWAQYQMGNFCLDGSLNKDKLSMWGLANPDSGMQAEHIKTSEDGDLKAYPTAFEWYKKAADQDHYYAKCTVFFMLVNQLVDCPLSIDIGKLKKEIVEEMPPDESTKDSWPDIKNTDQDSMYPPISDAIQYLAGYLQERQASCSWLKEDLSIEFPCGVNFDLGQMENHLKLAENLYLDEDGYSSLIMEYGENFINENRPYEIFQFYQYAWNLGDFDAGLYLGMCYDRGLACQQDQEKAMQIWHEIGSQTNISARFAAYFLLAQTYEKKDSALAFAYYQKAVKGDHAFYNLACYHLGNCYLKGMGCQQDNAKAQEVFESAVDNGCKVTVEALMAQIDLKEAMHD